MTREEVLETAKNCVCGNRQQDYGSPENNFQTIAALWREYIFRAHGQPVDLDVGDVAAMMILMKISRIASGNAKADNWIDIAGYAACGGELQDGR